MGISAISAGGGSLNMRMITLDAKTSLVGISSISARVGAGSLSSVGISSSVSAGGGSFNIRMISLDAKAS